MHFKVNIYHKYVGDLPGTLPWPHTEAAWFSHNPIIKQASKGKQRHVKASNVGQARQGKQTRKQASQPASKQGSNILINQPIIN